jgi:Tfp pilus assembly protein PilO
MAMEEQIEKYKQLKLSQRLAIAALIAILYPAYSYYEQSEPVQAAMDQAQTALDTETSKLSATEAKLKDLPAKLEQLSKLRTELSDNRQRISGSVEIDEILRKTATASRDAGARLDSFLPQASFEAGNRIKYSKQAIELSFQGKFAEVTRFIDNILNLGPLTYVTDIVYEATVKPVLTTQRDGVEPPEIARQRIEIKATAKMFVFKKIDVKQ